MAYENDNNGQDYQQQQYSVYDHFSPLQQMVLVVTPVLSGLLSLLGSSAIISMILCDFKKKSRSVKFRFLLGLSLSDILNSLVFCVWSLPLPQGQLIWGSLGNTSTCNVQGFLLQLGGISAVFNGALCHFFYYNICQNVKDEAYLKDHHYERFWVSLAVGFPISTGLVGILLDAYNPMSFGCWFAPLPLDCPYNDNVPCVRGQHAFLYGWIFMGVPLLIMLAVISTYMYKIHRHVREVMNRAQSHMSRMPSSTTSFRVGGSSTQSLGDISTDNVSVITAAADHHSTLPETNHTTRNDNGVGNNQNTTNNNHHHHRDNVPPPMRHSYQRLHRRKRETAIQAYWYIGIYLLTHMWNFLAYIMDMIPGVEQPFATVWLAQFFWPLQGFCNLFVFLRTRVATLRKRYPSFSYIQANWNALFHYEELIVAAAPQLSSRRLVLRGSGSGMPPVASNNNNMNIHIEDRHGLADSTTIAPSAMIHSSTTRSPCNSAALALPPPPDSHG